MLLPGGEQEKQLSVVFYKAKSAERDPAESVYLRIGGDTQTEGIAVAASD